MRRSTLLLALAFGPQTGSAQEPNQTLITNVHVFDGENETRIENADVLVEDNLIAQISTGAISARAGPSSPV